MTAPSRQERPQWLWVVEIYLHGATSGRAAWEPTVGAGLSRDDGSRVITLWREANPHDQFRLRKYRRDA